MRSRLARAARCLLVEEQDLADDRFHRAITERLGYEERGLRASTGRKPLRKRGNEYDRYREASQDIIDGVQAGASVSETNIRHYEAKLVIRSCLDGIDPGSGDGNHTMPEVFEYPLQIEGNQGFVLDDEDVRRNLPADFRGRLRQQAVYAALRNFEDASCLLLAEFLGGDQEECLSRLRREGSQRTSCAGSDQIGFRSSVTVSSGEGRQETLIETELGRQLWKDGWVGRDRFQDARNGAIACVLSTREQPRKTAQMRNMR